MNKIYWVERAEIVVNNALVRVRYHIIQKWYILYYICSSFLDVLLFECGLIWHCVASVFVHMNKGQLCNYFIPTMSWATYVALRDQKGNL